MASKTTISNTMIRVANHYKVLLLIETSELYGQRLLRGIVNYSQLHGAWMFCTNTPLYRRTRTDTKICAKDMGCNGVIVYMPGSTINIQSIVSGLPAVVFHDIIKIPSLHSCVSTKSDHRKTGEMGAEYLLRCGFRQFAYCGFKGMLWSDMRGKSFAQKIAQAGFDIHTYNSSRLLSKDHTLEISLLNDWLRLLPKPVGLMACNDDRGQQIIEACWTNGISVPDEVAVLGVDNDDLICGTTNPPLSSIALSAEKAGYEAAKILGELMSGQRIGSKEIVIEPTYIVTRQSTNILAIEDRKVAEAMRFIRKNIECLISVSDVVNEVACSHTDLAERFRRIIGHPIYEEISRARIERISRYLIESDMSVLQIAIKVGYGSVDHISRYFKKIKGITPREYRKKYR